MPGLRCPKACCMPWVSDIIQKFPNHTLTFLLSVPSLAPPTRCLVLCASVRAVRSTDTQELGYLTCLLGWGAQSRHSANEMAALWLLYGPACRLSVGGECPSPRAPGNYMYERNCALFPADTCPRARGQSNFFLLPSSPLSLPYVLNWALRTERPLGTSVHMT